MDTSSEKRLFLDPKEIEYIVLEGGGGKGFAYLGAVEALKKIEGFSFDNIKGYAGSSAGAITSLLLSLGITEKTDISKFMEKVKPAIFFDMQNFLKIPYPGGELPSPALEEIKRNDISSFEIAASWQVLIFLAYLFSNAPIKEFNSSLNKLLTYVYHTALSILTKIRNNVLIAFKGFILSHLIFRIDERLLSRALGIDRLLANIFDEIKTGGIETDPRYYKDIAFISDKTIEQLDGQIKKSIISFMSNGLKIEEELLKVFAYNQWGRVFFRDKGLCAALLARDLFDNTIADALKISKRGTTFQELWDLTSPGKRKKLLITGTNLSLGRTIVFSVDETPDFPVADAVRISMSLPLIFKPYEITEVKKGWPPKGVYVDGGVWNNLPSRLFDEDIKVTQDQADRKFYSIQPAKTLSIKLELGAPNNIDNVFSVVKALTFSYGLMGSGETQLYKQDFWRTIFLDTEPLELLKFSKPEPEVETRINKRSRRTVYRYFGLEPPAEDKDDNDDNEMMKRRTESVYGAN